MNINVVHLENVYVGNHGIIFDKNGDIIDRELLYDGKGINNHLRSFMCHENDPKFNFNLEQHTEEAKDQIKNNTYIQTNNDPYIHAFHFYNVYVYGHLWDSLNNLEDFEDINMPFKLAVSRITNHVQDLLMHFELCGYNKERVISFPYENKLYRFDNLYTSVINTSACHIRNKQWIEKKYIYENSYLKKNASNNEYRLFLSRNDYGKNNCRHLLNEDNVWDLLKNNGYIKINGTEGLLQHIEYFSRAKDIICTHGSMEKNIAFCLNKNVKIWEFYPLARMKTFPKYSADNVFQSMSRKMGILNHFFLPIESDKDQNVKFDLELIKYIISH